MRTSLVVLVALLLTPSASLAQNRSLRVQLEWAPEGVEITSVRWSDRPADPSTAPLRDPRVRIAEHPMASGQWTGQPVHTERSSSVLHLDPALRGLGILVSQPDLPPERLDVPLPGDEERGVDPEVLSFVESGDSAYRQDVVFLGDGYREEDRQRFIEDIEDGLAYLATIEPYSRYLPLVNAWGVFTPSVDAGADHLELSPATYADTPLGCHYGAFGIDRLIDCDAEAVLTAASFAPGEDVRVVLVNDPVYGGSGGTEFAVIFNGAEMEQGLAHEMAHTDGNLADEYDYGIHSNGEIWPMPNCSWSPDEVPWAAWIDEDSPGVGAIPPCSFSDYYRPTNETCLMNILQDEYCVVCREQLVRTIYSHLDRLLSSWTEGPVELDEGGVAQLAVQTFEPTGEPLYFTWHWVEGNVDLSAGEAASLLELSWEDLEPGSQTVRVTVEDPVTWVLTDIPPQMTDSHEFQVEVAEGSGPGPDDDDVDDDVDDDSPRAARGCQSCAVEPSAEGTSPSAGWLLLLGLVASCRARRSRTGSS